MIDPRDQWAIQIEVTNACQRKCSNCTRMLRHVERPFFVTTDHFARCVDAIKDFPTASPPSATTPRSLVGMIGGEPLFHPHFADLAGIMAGKIPNRQHRGLWTGLDWKQSQYAAIIGDTFGYVNNNQHNSECRHTPVLVAISDVVADAAQRAQLIDKCWLQCRWSSTVTPNGFFFCEVAGAMDVVFNGPGGLPIEPGCWERPLEDFREQINRWCPRCGIPMNLRARLDTEEVDDISPGNLELLQDSPGVRAGEYVLYGGGGGETTDTPWRYLR